MFRSVVFRKKLGQNCKEWYNMCFECICSHRIPLQKEVLGCEHRYRLIWPTVQRDCVSQRLWFLVVVVFNVLVLIVSMHFQQISFPGWKRYTRSMGDCFNMWVSGMHRSYIYFDSSIWNADAVPPELVQNGWDWRAGVVIHLNKANQVSVS